MLEYQMGELVDEREKLLLQINELQSTVSELKTNVQDVMSQHQRAKDETELLRRTLHETEEEAHALRIETARKTQDLERLNAHVEHCQTESELLRTSRLESNTMLKKNNQEYHRLKLEVTNSRRYSSLQQEDAANLANNIDKANKDIRRLNKQLMDAEKSCLDFQANNTRLEDEIVFLKTTLNSKLLELDDTKQQLIFFRNPKNIRRASSIYQLNAIEKIARNCVIDSDSEAEIASPTRRQSSLRQDMFVMLRRASDIYPTAVMERKETERSEIDNQDEYEDRRSSEVWHSPHELGSVDEHMELSGMQKRKMDIRNVYAHLTAAAVKSKYPEIEIPNVDLIRMSENMPFWELYPYFTHIFEGLQEKRRQKEPSTPKAGGWFSWMTGKK